MTELFSPWSVRQFNKVPMCAHNSQAGSPSRGAVAPSSSGIESGPANQIDSMTLPSNPFTHISHNAVSSQIAAVNGGHAPTDDAVPSGDESTATNPHSLPHPPATVQGSDTPSDDSALAGDPIQDQKS